MTKAPPAIVIDFETKPIQSRPDYPPKSVGYSIKWPEDRRPRYRAYAHPEGNNCSKKDAARELKAAWADPRPKMFYNSKFDVEVACKEFGLKVLPWELIHDPMFLVFLLNPHSRELGLKPMAEEFLDEPPEERDELEEWILTNAKELVAIHGLDYEGKKPSKRTVGRWIWAAPVPLVAKYANGDVRRTFRLFNKCYPLVHGRGMLPAYERERQLMPIFLANEQTGIRADVKRLEKDIPMYRTAMDKADNWLRKKFKAPDLNIDSNEDFAEQLAKHGIVRDEDWVYTKTGKRSTAKDNLTEDMFQDAKIARVYGYRMRMRTCLNTFMSPWLDRAQRNDGYITTHWNQVRQPGGGTRTGRPSTDDFNFLNISKTWDDKEDGYVHPKFLQLPELPLTRLYILPDEGSVFCHRDYNQQELRILAHFEDGALMEAYLGDLRIDVHNFVRDLIEDIVGLSWPRRPVKIVNFRTIYGGGAPATAAGVGCSMEEARQLLAAHGRALPGVKGLKQEIKEISAANQPLVTWGGREYFVEPPGWNEKYKRVMSYEYKLLNYLVLGSAADATKQALINYYTHPKRRGRFLVTVYDEINVSSHPEKTKRLKKLAVEHEMSVLRESMEGLEFDVPLLSDGKFGGNWAELQKFEEGPSVWEKAA